jgi:hypothetical protein
MYPIIKTFIDSGEDKFGSHNAYYSNAHAWLVERYGTLTSWYHDGIMMDSVEMSDGGTLRRSLIVILVLAYHMILSM